MSGPRTYFAIDLKSYYASAECAARGLDPLTTNLVVADASRTEKTICLAVSPSLKALGIPGRARLFEVVQKVKEANDARLRAAIRSRTAVKKEGKWVLSPPRPWRRTRRWKSATWWPRPGWPTTKKSPGKSTAST